MASNARILMHLKKKEEKKKKRKVKKKRLSRSVATKNSSIVITNEENPLGIKALDVAAEYRDDAIKERAAKRVKSQSIPSE